MCIRDYPEIRDLLSRGEINLCSVSLVAGILTQDNKNDLIPKIRNKSTLEVEEMVSRHRPVIGHRDRVRPVYVKRVVQLTEVEEGASQGDGADGGARPGDGTIGGARPGDSEPTTAGGDIRYTGIIDNTTPNIGSVKFPNPGCGDFGDAGERAGKTVNCTVLERRLKLDFTVSEEFMGKLERARSLLSNKHPRGLNFEKLFGILLDEYLDRHSPEGRMRRREIRKSKKNQSSEALKQVGAKTKEMKSKKDRGKSKREHHGEKKRPRRIPQRVRDEVFARDEGRCTFVGDDGVRCRETKYLQIDHIVPYARGGTNTADNLRLLCSKHNLLEAEKAYGKDHMKRFYRQE